MKELVLQKYVEELVVRKYVEIAKEIYMVS